jgi:hypothetical protein
MIIRKKMIRNLDIVLAPVAEDADVVIGIKNPERYPEVLKRVGLPLPLVIGVSILPRASFGPICRFNAEGKYIKHKEMEMETASRVVEWHWTEWHGQDRVEQTDFFDVPYKRYPRTFVPPYGEEITALKTSDGSSALVSRPIKHSKENKDILKHTINLFLEIFGECQIFSQDLQDIIKMPIRRLNWRILPEGQMPWERLRQEIEPIVQQASKGTRPFIWHRLEKISQFKPDVGAIGEGGFDGYIIMGFTKKNIFVCESCLYGNATYVFAENWEELAKMTKAQILNNNLQEDRIVHRAKEWDKRISKLFS